MSKSLPGHDSDQPAKKEPAAHSSRQVTEIEYKALKKKAADYLDGWQRAKADYANFKKDTEKQREELAQFATIAMVMDILPLHSNFARAIEHVPADQKEADWVKGFMAIFKQLDDLLRNMNIKEIETKQFDPAQHEAVEYKESPDHKEGEIITVTESGYQMLDKVIQPAKVVVASGKKEKSHDHPDPEPVEGEGSHKSTNPKGD